MFLIRSRFRGIISSSSSKQSSPMEQSTQNQSKYSKPISSFLNSPNFLGGFLCKSMLDHPSPTSILDTTNQFCNKDLFKPSSMEIKKHPYEQKGIGLALEEEEEEDEEDFDSFSKPERKMVIFGANLKKVQVQVPEPHVEQSASDLIIDLKSPSDYGIKTKNLQQLMQSENSSVKSHCLREIIGLSLSEMELSEEYTCVMKHGNDPKIIHIFDDMIVENYEFRTKGNCVNSLPVDFLGFCCNCKVKLDDDKDIYMYRGEKSFCSPECRFQEMIMEEDEEKEFQIF